jgi:hypothetical protein
MPGARLVADRVAILDLDRDPNGGREDGEQR